MNKTYIIFILVIGVLVFGAVSFFREPKASPIMHILPSGPMTGVEETENYRVAYAVPTEGALGAADIAAFVMDHVAEFKAQADRDVPELRKEGSATGKYMLDIGIEQHVTGTYLSYVVMIGEYTGGASANQTVRTFVYNRTTGEAAALADVVPSVDREDTMVAIRAKLYEVNGVTPEDKSVFGDVVQALVFEDLKNFYVTEEKIVVLFSKYEIAPGAAGVVLVEVPH